MPVTPFRSSGSAAIDARVVATPHGVSIRAVAPLLAALALSAVLNTWALAQNGYANVYYSAGVKSMLRSWHNFFFLSADPAGLISIDKPPLGLWLQAASAWVFGFSPMSLLLPEAIAGVIAVARPVSDRAQALRHARRERRERSDARRASPRSSRSRATTTSTRC